MKRIVRSIVSLSLVVMFLTAICGVATSAEVNEYDLPALAKSIRPSVFLIVVYDSEGKERGSGTGFVVSDKGHMVTSRHVIEGATRAIAKSESGEKFGVLGYVSEDALNDVIILKTAQTNTPALKLGDPEKVEVGGKVIVVGSPLGLEGTVSDGVVSAIRKIARQEDWLQITAPISPGSSGSPVLEPGGSVIGVAEAVVRQGQNLNFAVSVKAIKKLLEVAVAEPRQLCDLAVLESPVASLYADEEYLAFARAYNDGRFAEALAVSNRLIKRLPDNGQVVLFRAYTLESLGMMNEAEGAYRKAAVLVPQLPDAWFQLGRFQLQAGRTHDAIKSIENALNVDPNNFSGWMWLAAIYDKNEKIADRIPALFAYRRAVTIKPTAIEAWILMGTLELFCQHYEQATTSFEKAIELDPDNCRAQVGVAKVFRWKEEHEKARALLEKITEKYPGCGEAWSEFGQYWVFHGEDVSKGISMLKRALKLNPSDDVTFYLGMALVKGGQLEDAMLYQVMLEDSGKKNGTAKLRSEILKGMIEMAWKTRRR